MGLPVADEGYVLMGWGDEVKGSTIWGPFPSDTRAFEWPAAKQWMINYRVDDLDGMLQQLTAALDQARLDPSVEVVHLDEPSLLERGDDPLQLVIRDPLFGHVGKVKAGRAWLRTPR